MSDANRYLWSGNEALAAAAGQCGVRLGVGYPGTPSTEILENFPHHAPEALAQWAPNEKVALEVGLGAAYAGARTLVTMKHVGLNVAADPLFIAAYTGVVGGLVIVVADDPGMASSQNEQDSRYYARAAGAPMLEPADSQEAFDHLDAAMRLSEQFALPVLLRTSTRVCHSKTIVRPRPLSQPAHPVAYARDPAGRVMIPLNARPAHRRLREKLRRMVDCSLMHELTVRHDGDGELGIIASGVAFQHAREAAPTASMLKLGLTWPLPMDAIADFAASVRRCVVVEEGENVLAEAIAAAGVEVEPKADVFRFGELNVARVRALLAGQTEEPPPPPPGKPPQLCPGCPHRVAFEILSDLGCHVAGDIGCYTLGALPPLSAMDSQGCMGASIGVGLGLRRVLPAEQARRVVSVLGDSTFIHSGITGLADMVYNGPAHVVLILDNSTTAMTGLQEHPGTGRSLNHRPAGQVVLEELCRGMGVKNVHVLDPLRQKDEFRQLLKRYIEKPAPAVIIARRTCLLAAGKIKEYERAAHQTCAESQSP